MLPRGGAHRNRPAFWSKSDFLRSSSGRRPTYQCNSQTRLQYQEAGRVWGYSVEVILFEQGKLANADGTGLTELAFQQQAMGNARLDKCPFYLTKNPGPDGIWPNTPFQPNPDGTWPPESDEPFIEYALQRVVPLLQSRMVIIEALASMLTTTPLDEEEIDAIRRDFS
jgi:hypothetical protein